MHVHGKVLRREMLAGWGGEPLVRLDIRDPANATPNKPVRHLYVPPTDPLAKLQVGDRITIRSA